MWYDYRLVAFDNYLELSLLMLLLPLNDLISETMLVSCSYADAIIILSFPFFTPPIRILEPYNYPLTTISPLSWRPTLSQRLPPRRLDMNIVSMKR